MFFFNIKMIKRHAAEWLEWLGNGAEKRVFEAGLRHATTGKLCQPSSKSVLVLN